MLEETQIFFFLGLIIYKNQYFIPLTWFLYIIKPRKKILVFVYHKAKGIKYWFLYIIRPRGKILVFVYKKVKGKKYWFLYIIRPRD